MVLGVEATGVSGAKGVGCIRAVVEVAGQGMRAVACNVAEVTTSIIGVGCGKASKAEILYSEVLVPVYAPFTGLYLISFPLEDHLAL